MLPTPSGQGVAARWGRCLIDINAAEASRAYPAVVVPRYYFHSADALPFKDSEGVLLPDAAAARQEAMRLAGEILRGSPQAVWERGKWSVGVMDAKGTLLFTIVTVAAEVRPSDQWFGSKWI